MAQKPQTLLERLSQQASSAAVNKKLSMKSAQWFRLKLREIRTLRPTRLMQEQKHHLRAKGIKGRQKLIGRMFSFFYDPKMKETLPWYDRFPLVIPIQETTDGFIGLNLHYLSPRIRMFFLARLASFVSDDRYDEKTRMRLAWRLVKGGKLGPYTKKTVKRYIRTNIQSRLLEFPADEWVMAAFLPTENFVGAGKSKIWIET